MKKNKEQDWTKEQIESFGKAIEESEQIGYTGGWDDAIKETIKDLEIILNKFMLELKMKVYINKDGVEKRKK